MSSESILMESQITPETRYTEPILTTPLEELTSIPNEYILENVGTWDINEKLKETNHKVESKIERLIGKRL